MRLSSSPKDPLVLTPFEGFLGLFVSFVFFFLFFSFTASAYTVPDQRYIIVADTVELGSVDILIPVGSKSYFSLSGSEPVNISGSTVTGYFNYQGREYSVRWPTFSTAEYRLSSGSNVWSPLTISVNLDYSTVHFLSDLDTSQLNNSGVLNLLFLAISIFICYLLLRRRLT